MKMFVFEGTPEEISKVMQTIQPLKDASAVAADAAQQALPSHILSESVDGPTKFVTVKFARRVLTRRALSGPMKAVLRALYAAYPEWVSSNDLYEASDYSVQQFSGLMGAFGRRMSYTEGYDEGAEFFDYRENADTGAWEYRLPDSVREALEAEHLV